MTGFYWVFTEFYRALYCFSFYWNPFLLPKPTRPIGRSEGRRCEKRATAIGYLFLTVAAKETDRLQTKKKLNNKKKKSKKKNKKQRNEKKKEEGACFKCRSRKKKGNSSLFFLMEGAGGAEKNNKPPEKKIRKKCGKIE